MSDVVSKRPEDAPSTSRRPGGSVTERPTDGANDGRPSEHVSGRPEKADILATGVTEEDADVRSVGCELALIFLLVSSILCELAAIVTPGWLIVTYVAGGVNTTTWTSIYYTTTCVVTSNTSTCESKTILQEHIEQYLKATDNGHKNDLSRF